MKYFDIKGTYFLLPKLDRRRFRDLNIYYQTELDTKISRRLNSNPRIWASVGLRLPAPGATEYGLIRATESRSTRSPTLCRHLWSLCSRACRPDVASRISPEVLPAVFYRWLFSYIRACSHRGEITRTPGRDISLSTCKTSAFVTGKCRLKVQSAGGTCQDGVNMAYWWCIFGHAHYERKKREVSRELDILVDFYSVMEDSDFSLTDARALSRFEIVVGGSRLRCRIWFSQASSNFKMTVIAVWGISIVFNYRCRIVWPRGSHFLKNLIDSWQSAL